MHGFTTERQIEDKIFEWLVSQSQAKLRIHRQYRLACEKNGSYDKPDLIIETTDKAIVLEVKLYRGIEPDLIQLSRYLRNRAIQNQFSSLSLHGVLVAHSYDIRKIQSDIIKMKGCSCYSYASDKVLPLSCVAGDDVLNSL